jgi:hypothetical protein
MRASWESYVYSAFACGFFDGDRGKDLRGRLASKGEHDFRSAMAECLTCWFLAARLRFTVTPDAPGRGAKNLDMMTIIGSQEVGVEVKAPYREMPPPGTGWHGDDADLLANRLESAQKQFSRETANILVIVPQLRTPVHSYRTQLVTALYGEEKITCQIDLRTGAAVGPITTEFFHEGKLLRRRQPSGALIKPDGSPGFTRVSTVIVIEERIREKYPPPPLGLWREIVTGNTRSGGWEDAWNRQMALHLGPENYCWIDHNILVAHNPNAHKPISPNWFQGFVQFMDLGIGEYGWSDGQPL